MKKVNAMKHRGNKNNRFKKVITQKTRKQLRKEQRVQKKVRKNQYYQRKRNSKFPTEKKEHNSGERNSTKEEFKKESIFSSGKKEDDKSGVKNSKKKEPKSGSKRLTFDEKIERSRNSDKKVIEQLQEDMKKERINQLKMANEEEDEVIKQMEKNLKLKKRKTNSLPKAFASDGLDYLLEVCEPDNLKESVLIDQNLQDSDSEFEEDFAMVTGDQKKNEKGDNVKRSRANQKDDDSTEEDDDDDDDQDAADEDEMILNKYDNVFNSSEDDDDDDDYAEELNLNSGSENEMEPCKKKKGTKRKLDSETKNENISSIMSKSKKLKSGKTKTSVQEFVEQNTDMGEDRKKNSKSKKGNKIKRVTFEIDETVKKNKKRKIKNLDSDDDESIEKDSNFSDDDIMSEDENESENRHEDGNADGTGDVWEDIYGRTRDKKGNVVQVKSSKYVPPHLREKSNDKTENQIRLRRQMKGLINRLSENNMTSISSQIEELYMSNSRNDMNETLINLLMESLVAPAITAERLIMEQAMLVAILHANVGTEVGAHVLQTLVREFNEKIQNEPEVENKEVDNIILILSHMYNFKIFSSVLMYDILEKLTESFGEKEVELNLIILKTVGFSLRKDDPLALKDFILKIQHKAGEAVQINNNPRVNFMLEVLLAIKNNNMSKIPNYDPSHSEHLKKIIKGFLRKGNYITELKISLEDLLKADERGKWWVVGSAWTGVLPGERGSTNELEPQKQKPSSQYSLKLLDLARKQRMNTDVRRNIFCTLMTAEDYLDAFEKLLHLGLKNQQEREYINVIMHCCLQEKKFNPYYSYLAQKFCDFDRKYQMTIQYALWDKFKELQNISSTELTNLAKFLVHILVEKGLPLSVLKVIHFAEVDKATVKFLRQVILGILLHKSEETVQEVFQRVAVSEKLHVFREGIRLFIHHFLLRNLNNQTSDNVELLKKRTKMVDKILKTAESKVKF